MDSKSRSAHPCLSPDSQIHPPVEARQVVPRARTKNHLCSDLLLQWSLPRFLLVEKVGSYKLILVFPVKDRSRGTRHRRHHPGPVGVEWSLGLLFEMLMFDQLTGRGMVI